VTLQDHYNIRVFSMKWWLGHLKKRTFCFLFKEVHNVYKNIHQIFFIMLVGYVRFLVRSTKDLETGTCSLNETELNYFHNF